MKMEDLSDQDQLELNKFFQFCDLVRQAKEAGQEGPEVEERIYKEVYEAE